MTSAEQYLQTYMATKKDYATKATFLRQVVCFERYANIRHHYTYIIILFFKCAIAVSDQCFCGTSHDNLVH